MSRQAVQVQRNTFLPTHFSQNCLDANEHVHTTQDKIYWITGLADARSFVKYTKVNILLHAIQLRSKLSYRGLSTSSVLCGVAIMMQQRKKQPIIPYANISFMTPINAPDPHQTILTFLKSVKHTELTTDHHKSVTTAN